MNYEEMSDHEINMAVTCIENKCQGWSVLGDNSGFYHCGVDDGGFYEVECVDYCNNPLDAWPIIVDNGISIKHLPESGNEYATEEWWCAGRRKYKTFGKNPLRAAMICFLKMKDVENA